MAPYVSSREELTRAEYDARVHEGQTLSQLQHLFWADFGPSHVPVRKDNDRVAINFPVINQRIISPAFEWPETILPGFSSGTASPTDEATFDRFVQEIADRNSWIQVKQASFTSEEGFEFRYILLSTSSNLLDVHAQRPSKTRIWMQAGVHGNEPAADQAILALLGKMDLEPSWAISILEELDILIFPRYNPEGISDFYRPSSSGIDLNRDHVRLEVPQSRHIRKLFCQFEPHVAVDMHEYSGRARYGKYVHGSDIMFCAAKNLNIHPEIRQISEHVFASAIGRKLKQSNFRWEPYVPTDGSSVYFKEAGSDGKIGRNVMGLTQCISLLCESRGIGIADQHFQRRTAASLTFLEGVLEVTQRHAELVRTTVEDSIKHFIDATPEIVVKDQPTKAVDRTFTMIDSTTGTLSQLPVRLAGTTPTTPTMIRSKPEAYILPSCLTEVVQRLVDSGLEVDRIQLPRAATVEVLTVSTAVFESTYYEGIVPMRVTTTVTTTEIQLPAGMYVLTTRQKNAALAFVALEPENVDSYVTTNIIPLVAGDEYPIYRLMKWVEA